MLGGQNEDLLEIERLINYQKYQEADSKLEAFEIKNNLSKEEELRIDILRAVIMKETGHWQEGSDLIEQIVEDSKEFENKLVFLDALIIKADYLASISKYDEVIAIADRGIKIAKKEDTTNKEYILRKAWFLLNKGFSQSNKGEYKIAQELLEQGIKLAEEVDNDHLIIWLYLINHLNEAQCGELQKALNHLYKALESSMKIQNDIFTADVYSSIAEVFHFMGKYKSNLEYIEKARKIYQENNLPTLHLEFKRAFNYWSSGRINESMEIYKRVLPQLEEMHGQNPRLRGFYFWNKAMIEWCDGNLDKAIELTEEAYNISLELGNRYLIMGYAALLGLLLLDSNQIERAKRLCLASLEDYKEFHFPLYKSINNEVLGRIFHIRREYDLSLEYLEKSLELRMESDMFYQAFRVLFHLLNVAIDMKDEDLCNKYLKQMTELQERDPQKAQKQFYLISKALVLKESSHNWKNAIEILVDIIGQEIHYYPLKVIALINLCELLMNEFSISGNLEVLEELEKYAKELEVIANSQKLASYTLRIEAKNIQLLTIWLKAQFFGEENKLKKAEILLDEACMVADKEGLFRLAYKLTQQQEKLYSQIIK